MYVPTKVRSLPGIKRDGTRLEGNNYVDGLWCRFQRGLPRKMGGYVSVSQNLPERIYGLHSFSSNARQYVHLGSASELQQRVINNSGVVTGANDRTPAGLVADADNVWTFDVLYDKNLSAAALIAHAAPSLEDLSSATDTDIFYGGVTDSGILLTSAQTSVSGGVIVVGNYLVAYGSDGYVQWGEENDVVNQEEASANITQQKIVAGRRVRGGGVPAALLWSLDSLIQMTFAGVDNAGAALWSFNTITEESSILSSRGVIEYDGVFYWAGVDRFLSYNGVVREVPNQFNVNFFFDNLNEAKRQKVFAYKVPRFGEIWWCFPFGSSEECNHAVILNVREGYWYDTPLPEDGRTDGLYPKVYFKPFMTGVRDEGSGFDLWQHETGVNAVRSGDEEPIPSYFETHEFALPVAESEASDKGLSISFVEPDFVQVGDMTCTVRGRANARSPIRDSASVTITETATDADDQVIRFKEQRRLLSLKFESNTLDGDYQMGDTLAHLQPADARITE